MVSKTTFKNFFFVVSKGSRAEKQPIKKTAANSGH